MTSVATYESNKEAPDIIHEKSIAVMMTARYCLASIDGMDPNKKSLTDETIATMGVGGWIWLGFWPCT